MRSGSQAALDRACERWGTLLTQRGSGEVELAKAIFAVADIIRDNRSLAVALQESARDPQDRANLASQVFNGKIHDEVTELVIGLAREAWSEEGDLVAALEELAVYTVMTGAQRAGELSHTEEQLYQSLRALKEQRELRLILADKTYDVAARVELLNKVFTGHNDYTRELLARAVTHCEIKTLAQSITGYIAAAADQGDHIVASVTAATPLTREQEERLTAILQRAYNTDVRIHVVIDPSVIGGLRIHVGEDVIDGTLASRISGVREAFTN